MGVVGIPVADRQLECVEVVAAVEGGIGVVPIPEVAVHPELVHAVEDLRRDAAEDAPAEWRSYAPSAVRANVKQFYSPPSRDPPHRPRPRRRT